jgi:hypothetical protein
VLAAMLRENHSLIELDQSFPPWNKTGNWSFCNSWKSVDQPETVSILDPAVRHPNKTPLQVKKRVLLARWALEAILIFIYSRFIDWPLLHSVRPVFHHWSSSMSNPSLSIGIVLKAGGPRTLVSASEAAAIHDRFMKQLLSSSHAATTYCWKLDLSCPVRNTTSLPNLRLSESTLDKTTGNHQHP